MTVQSELNRNQYPGDGVQTIFVYGVYVVLDATHMKVYLDDVPQASGYTVDNIGNPSGGNVTFDTAPGDQVIVTLIREVPLTQLADYTEFDRFPAKQHESALDLGVMGSQQLKEEIDRTVRFPPSDPGAGQLPARIALKYLGTDESKNFEWRDGTNDPTADASNQPVTAAGSGFPTILAARFGRKLNIQDNYGYALGSATGLVTAFDLAITEAKSRGGGTIKFNNGLFIADRLNTRPGAVEKLLIDADNIHLELGDETLIQNAAGLAGVLINFEKVSGGQLVNVGLHGGRIDGQRGSIPNGHTVRLWDVLRGEVEGVHIYDSPGYGVGLQIDAAGQSFQDIHLHDLLIERCSRDCVDIKAWAALNKAVLVSDSILRHPGEDPAQANAAALDWRGLVEISNVTTELKSDAAQDRTGFQAQWDQAGGQTGSGAHRSKLVNCHTIADAVANTQGFDIQARDVQLGNCGSQGCGKGARIRNRAIINGLACENGTDGILFEELSGNLPGAEGSMASGLLAEGNTGIAIDLNDERLQIVSFHSVNNSGTGLRINKDECIISAGEVSGNGTDVVENVPTSHIGRINGYPTKVNLVSGDLDLDTGATPRNIDATVAHGMPFTPSRSSIQHSLDYVSGSRDVVLAYDVVLLGVDGTNITLRARITTNDTAGTAVARFNVHIDARP